MKRNKIRRLLDFIPLVILIVYAFILILTVSTSDYILTWRNIVYLILLIINCLVFFKQHKVGVLTLGLTLLLGLLGIISYVPALTFTTVSLAVNNSSATFRADPIFILWLLIHFIFSGRYYFGILTKRYWQDLTQNWKAASLNDGLTVCSLGVWLYGGWRIYTDRPVLYSAASGLDSFYWTLRLF